MPNLDRALIPLGWEDFILFASRCCSFRIQKGAALSWRGSTHTEGTALHHLHALYLQCGPVLSQVLPGDRTFTSDVFQHYNILMPSESVGPAPQYRQMGRQGCTDRASVGPEHHQEGGTRLDGSGSTRSRHRVRHESC